MTSIMYMFLENIEIVRCGISHMQIVIGNNQGNRMFILYVTWKAFIEKYAINAVNSPIIIIDSRSKYGIC